MQQKAEQAPAGKAIRIVDKSLPVLPLLAQLMARLDTKRIIGFHLPVTQAVLATFSNREVLFGKPPGAVVWQTARAGLLRLRRQLDGETRITARLRENGLWA